MSCVYELYNVATVRASDSLYGPCFGTKSSPESGSKCVSPHCGETAGASQIRACVPTSFQEPQMSPVTCCVLQQVLAVSQANCHRITLTDFPKRTILEPPFRKPYCLCAAPMSYSYIHPTAPPATSPLVQKSECLVLLSTLSATSTIACTMCPHLLIPLSTTTSRSTL